MTAEPPPDALNIAGNVLAAVIGVLVLIPRTRAFGALLAVGNMFVSMYLNHTYDGVDYFVDLIPYNVGTITLAAILVGRYARDLPHTFRGGYDELIESESRIGAEVDYAGVRP